MKKYLVILFIGAAGMVSAQQIALSSQYLFNEFLINPGATGSKDYTPIQLNFRKQWTRFPGSPTTQSLSCHSKIYDRLGFGGYLFNDVAGPSRRTGLNVSTAYHLKLDKRDEHKLGLGLSVSLTQHLIDVTKLTTYLPDDPAVLRGYNNQMVPDANFGAYYYYKDKGFVGISAHNLAELKKDLYDFNGSLSNPLVRTYYLYGGYNFNLGNDFGLKTVVLGEVIETGTFQFDGTLVGSYKNMIWLGASYRYLDAVVGLIGGQAGPFKFGYAYDYTLSDIGDYSNGSHEIFLELQIFPSDGGRTPWLKRNRIYSPKI